MECRGETISSASPPSGVKGQPSRTQEQTGRKVILVVDDNQVFQKAMLMKLRACGYDVMTAEDGSAALAAVGRLKPDLILLDINFPPDVANGGGLGWDGFLILRWLRRTREAVNVPVIAVTSGDLNLYREHCKEAGILDLLPKPLDHELLVTRIRAALNQPEPEIKPPPSPQPNFHSVRRILFIDDDSPWRQGAIRDLSQQGYEVVTTDTAEGALSDAARIRPDLMILDLKLEKEAAPLRVMVLLLAAHPTVPLLVYAGMGVGEEAKRELMNLGVFQILQRRTMDELLTAVRLASEQPRRSAGAPEAQPETMPSEAEGRFETILIVENDLKFSELLRGYLESQSFYVTCVPNATEALRQMAATDFDVILTEMVLPGHSGEEFYNEVERMTPELCRRFIFMTGHEAEPRTDNFIRRSRAPMLWKPFPLADVLPAAQTVRQKVRLARLVARSRAVTAV
ncbi:MAG TPA: response regulator [Verrucomicrobiae bacterium]|nr:response regulator [Verrucomicrobiae bacterium]